MVTRRLITALFVAFVLSGLFTWWFSKKVAHTPEAKLLPTHRTVSVDRNVAAGEPLQPAFLQLSDWTSSQPLAGSFDKLDEPSGRVLLVPLAAGEMVLAHDLAASGAGSGLMARVPKGMRALTIRANEIAGDTSFLVPGSLVDVLATYRPANATDLITSTVLQSVRVLAMGTSLDPNTDTKAQAPPSVTVLLSPQDAQKLTLAASLGKVVFVLRNGTDREPVKGLLAVNSPTTEVAVALRQTRPPVTRPQRDMQADISPRFTVETISGSKQSTESFGGEGK